MTRVTRDSLTRVTRDSRCFPSVGLLRFLGNPMMWSEALSYFEFFSFREKCLILSSTQSEIQNLVSFHNLFPHHHAKLQHSYTSALGYNSLLLGNWNLIYCRIQSWNFSISRACQLITRLQATALCHWLRLVTAIFLLLETRLCLLFRVFPNRKGMRKEGREGTNLIRVEIRQGGE